MKHKGLLLNLEAMLKEAHFTQEHLNIIEMLLQISSPARLECLFYLTKSCYKKERLEKLKEELL